MRPGSEDVRRVSEYLILIVYYAVYPSTRKSFSNAVVADSGFNIKNHNSALLLLPFRVVQTGSIFTIE